MLDYLSMFVKMGSASLGPVEAQVGSVFLELRLGGIFSLLRL